MSTYTERVAEAWATIETLDIPRELLLDLRRQTMHVERLQALQVIADAADSSLNAANRIKADAEQSFVARATGEEENPDRDYDHATQATIELGVIQAESHSATLTYERISAEIALLEDSGFTDAYRSEQITKMFPAAYQEYAAQQPAAPVVLTYQLTR